MGKFKNLTERATRPNLQLNFSFLKLNVYFIKKKLLKFIRKQQQKYILMSRQKAKFFKVFFNNVFFYSSLEFISEIIIEHNKIIKNSQNNFINSNYASRVIKI